MADSETIPARVEHHADAILRAYGGHREVPCPRCHETCEWCNPLTAAELAERQKLRDILATALAKDKVAEMRDSERPQP